jgi:hypothetical protein
MGGERERSKKGTWANHKHPTFVDKALWNTVRTLGFVLWEMENPWSVLNKVETWY